MIVAVERFAAVWARIGGYAAGLLLVYIALHTIVEITLRGLFGFSTLVHVEFVGYALASMTFLALAQTMRDGALVRVNILLTFAPRGIRRVLDAFCVIVTALIVGFAAWYVWFDIHRGFVRGHLTDSIITMPVWMPRVGMLVGLLIFLIDLVVQALLIVFSRRTLAEQPNETK